MKNIKTQIFIEVDTNNNILMFTNETGDKFFTTMFKALNEFVADNYGLINNMEVKTYSIEET